MFANPRPTLPFAIPRPVLPVAIPRPAIPFAAWPPMVAAFALAAVLFGISALQMVAAGLDAPGDDVRLKAGVPPAVLRNMPSVKPAASPAPKLPTVKVITAAAAMPETAPAATMPAQVAYSPDPADAPDTSATGLAPAAQMQVVSDVTVHAEPRTQSRPVGTLHGGDQVEVAAREGGWILVRQGRDMGWVWGEFLAPA